MNNRLVSFYNQNRYLIWIIVLIIAAIIILLRVLNGFVEKKQVQEAIDNLSDNNTAVRKLDENYSVMTGYKMDNDTGDIIEDFIDYCNEGDIEQAYKLLSDDCKNLLYPDLNSFKENYYDVIFATKKLYSSQAMINTKGYYIYQISFREDILATRQNNRLKYY